MRSVGFGIVTLLILTTGRASAGQQALGAEQRVDTERLRALASQTRDLPLDKVVVTVMPPTPLWMITAATTDRHGTLHVLHRPATADRDDQKQADPVVVVSPEGRRLRTMGRGMFGIPHGIRVDGAGNIWTIDANRSVVIKFSPSGEKLMDVSVGDIPQPDRPFCGATDVAFADNGRFFVSDGYCNSRVIEYDAAGRKLREFGRRGTGPGEFMVVHGLAMGPDGTLYVADRENGRVQWFRQDGTYVGEKRFGGQLFSVAVDATGAVWVGTQPRGVPFGTDAHIFKFDPGSGAILGKLASPAHQLSIGPAGELVPGTGGRDVVVWRLRR